ncbi:MAG: DEAD/DEAH box helicase, partial [Lentisphaerota bacterium]
MYFENPELKKVIENTAYFFGENSPLKNSEKQGGYKYEERPQQRDMAISVAESLASSENLCIEAPTGVGKSIAYLVPSIYYALATEKPVIITTETINLQEQLIDKDIPLIKKLFNREFKACLAMGRSNYLCRRRLDLIMSGHSNEYIPSDSLVEDLNFIIKWAKFTTTGTKSDMKYEPKIYAWQCVCSETNTCTGDKCKYYNNCFYTNACKSIAQANVIVANHAMFFSDLKMKMQGFSGIFPQYSAVIIDESHHLEDTAAK